LALITADLVEKQTTLDTLVSERAGMPDDDHTTLATAVANLRDTVAAAQVELRQATIAVERHQQDQARRQARLHGIADQRIALHNRTARAQEHLAELQARLKTTEQKIASLAAQPDALRDARHQLMSSASILETQKQSADDALQACENDVAASTKALKEAEANLAQTREQRAGLLARRQGLQERLQVLEQEIIANFAMNPLGLMQAANLDYEAAPEILATIDDKRARKDKAVSDRNNIGPVNLRADVEAQEITAQLGLAATERDDLLAAIAELRGAITTINHEARERLTAAFDTINAHFKDLFTRLFGGGQAHLQLIETDGDPLGAGLEIFAQPPGKTLQTISLLSGGEQSLTAAALIFAMFLTNPSPICVLDEIDAPLDDANVDRICNLLRHITDTCQTRFLVVTHHRLTMARMDRLFGVTMGEKGVSQLVSVDLQQQLDLLEAA
jgi:chromosome segregation protein